MGKMHTRGRMCQAICLTMALPITGCGALNQSVDSRSHDLKPAAPLVRNDSPESTAPTPSNEPLPDSKPTVNAQLVSRQTSPDQTQPMFGKRLPTSHCWYGNYLGPGNCGYDVPPIDALDLAARTHDQVYDKFHVDGCKGALTCLDVRKADLKLAGDSFRAIPHVAFKGKLVAVATGVSFGSIGASKMAAAGVVGAVHKMKQVVGREPVARAKGE
jgi:hypothetical protein